MKATSQAPEENILPTFSCIPLVYLLSTVLFELTPQRHSSFYSDLNGSKAQTLMSIFENKKNMELLCPALIFDYVKF